MLAVLLLNRMTTKSRIAAKQKDLHKIKAVKVEPLKTPGDSIGDCCRTCLSTEDLEPIFPSKEAEKKKSHELNVVTGLEIKIDDGLSQKMCKNCLYSLKTALQFRRCSRKAEKTLLDMAITGKPKKKNKIRKKEIKNQKLKVKDESNDTLDAFADFEHDEYQNDCSFENDDFDNESYEDIKESNIVKIEYDPKDNDKQPRVKRKRTTLPNASSYKCPICQKEFRMKATYKAHLRFHTNYCVCEVSIFLISIGHWFPTYFVYYPL
ncbi:unnamed protein product [Diatraea saccharalis]|uniref:Uncharacterized protein n=1 Tax=Diatraea saccharalis TaxID=40085 RepID=A0A9N9WGJ2_9NEOP|nr:unnamed protein product [Diatraea saccharalis]